MTMMNECAARGSIRSTKRDASDLFPKTTGNKKPDNPFQDDRVNLTVSETS